MRDPYRTSSPPEAPTHPTTVRVCLYCGELLELRLERRAKCPALHPPVVPLWRALLELVAG